MKMIKLTGYKKMLRVNGKATSKTYQDIVYVNPAYIVSIEPHSLDAVKNDFVNIPEQKGCEVGVASGLGKTYYHHQPAEKLLKQIDQAEENEKNDLHKM